VLTLVCAPLFRAGQDPLSLLGLQLLAIGLLGLSLWHPSRLELRSTEWLALGLLFLFPTLYLIDVPSGLLGAIPGYQPYRAILELLSPGQAGASLSLIKLTTQMAWLVLLVPIAVYLGTRGLSERAHLHLISLLLGLATFEATLGLIQYGAAQGGVMLFGIDLSEAGASGTFPNRNHLAGLLNMALPITLALLLYYLGRDRGDNKEGWRKRVSFFASLRGHTALLYGALAILLVLGIIFSRSRAGIALAILGILLTTSLFARRIGGDNVFGTSGTVVAIIIAIAISIGLAPVLDRFALGGVQEDARWPILSAAMDGLAAFLPLGSGPGTFPAVFPAYQPQELGAWFINRAHNDYIEWVFDGGIPAALLILFLLGLYVHQWTRIYSRDRWSRYRFVQVAAGIGLLLLLLHEFFDYNLHTPANLVVFAFLAGVFFSPPGQVESGPSRRRQRRRTPNLTAGTTLAQPGAPIGQPTPDQIPNPFL